MAKDIIALVKLQVPGGQANPAPPVGPALGQHQVNIGEFVRRFNDMTKDRMGVQLPVVVTIYKDRSFDLTIKSPPAAYLLKKAAGIAKGSSNPSRETAGTVTRAQILEIANTKMADLNAPTIEKAAKMIAGTARSIGLQVVD